MANGARVKKRHTWLSWNYREEEKWLTEQSAAGWHVVKPNAFSQELEKDDSVRYVYRIDYQHNSRNKADFADYLQLYADDGWEYVGTVSGMWHYFRKARKGDETYELYTDRSSLKSFYRKIQGTLGVIGLVNLVLFIVNGKSLVSRYSGGWLWTLGLAGMALYAALIGLLFYGYARMGRMIKQADAD
ncbi:DUF2812 domain-containing protein [Cohnella lubricantis]|uniref:DUF2812 domain-containing protein n=1 Tax=Cohnella lubricantis TaxID=2163172 RepID=A0A841TCG7_9BACL|nr:DUF2812 domain-containing protein [Cohnella lubricantis]MBB6677058.1 DUF2812 domain-containing protein [Cohnella lubricantis]MBP2118905.1 putative integral membrane protein [Cohnella lubricantis]